MVVSPAKAGTIGNNNAAGAAKYKERKPNRRIQFLPHLTQLQCKSNKTQKRNKNEITYA
jgi:hypothetical protein